MSDIDAVHTLLEAITTRDYASVAATLDTDATMRALLPSDTVEIRGAHAIADRFSAWFGSADSFELLDSAVTPVGDHHTVTYRVRVRRTSNDAEHEIQQSMVIVAEGARVAAINLVCTGFRPIGPARSGDVADFDAGTLGCADGLAVQFREQMRRLEVGDALRVRTTDASAKQELPSLARLMGHTIMSTEAHDDGSLTITVERGR